jgi:hypothetical protein
MPKSLQEFCDDIEKSWPVLIQIKQETRKVYAGYGTFFRLVVILKSNTSFQITSEESRMPAFLKWWLTGVLEGMMLWNEVIKYKDSAQKVSEPQDETHKACA